MLALTSNYAPDEGIPEQRLSPLAAAGFVYVHWAHGWNSDYLYTNDDIQQAREWLKNYGLKLADLHASAGIEKDWLSTDENTRTAGVELVKNRMRMTARLGGETIVLHMRPQPADGAAREQFWRAARKPLDELQSYAQEHWVRIALENLQPGDNYATLEQVLSAYSAEFVGLCYDSGHGQLIKGGLDFLERMKDRLLAVHLHDNDGKSDLHRLPFNGSVDWRRLMQLIADSPYDGPVTLEAFFKHSGFKDVDSFLRQANFKANTLAQMIGAQREKSAEIGKA